MIFCYNCGKKTDNNAEFCGKCGIELYHGMSPGVMKSRPKTRASIGEIITLIIVFGIILIVIVRIIYVLWLVPALS